LDKSPAQAIAWELPEALKRPAQKPNRVMVKSQNINCRSRNYDEAGRFLSCFPFDMYEIKKRLEVNLMERISIYNT